MNGALRRWAIQPEIVDRLTPVIVRLAFDKHRKGRVVRCVSYLIGRLYGIGHLFDASWYRKRYPDIIAAGVDPLLHYMSHGWRERRDPSPNFSTSAYLAAHPLVEKS